MPVSSPLNLMTTLAQAKPAEAPKPVIAKPDLSVVSQHASDTAGLIPTHWLLIAAGVVLLILSGLSIANWWKHRGEHAHPLLVFSTTAQLAGLSYRNQWTLLRMAHHQSLRSPLTLMLSPDTFDHHARAYLDSRLNWRQEPVRRQLQSIRETLFSDLPNPPVAA